MLHSNCGSNLQLWNFLTRQRVQNHTMYYCARFEADPFVLFRVILKISVAGDLIPTKKMVQMSAKIIHSFIVGVCVPATCVD